MSKDLAEGNVVVSSNVVGSEGSLTYGLDNSYDFNKGRASASCALHDSNTDSTGMVTFRDLKNPKQVDLALAKSFQDFNAGMLVNVDHGHVAPKVTVAFSRKIQKSKLTTHLCTDSTFAASLEMPLSKSLSVTLGMKQNIGQPLTLETLKPNSALTLSFKL